jgi:hypothetical protein
MLNANPAIGFIFLSGAGADPQEKSRTLFARVKGKTENNLKRLPFKKLFIARAGGIIPVHRKENAAFFEKLLIPLYPVFQLLMPGKMISSVVRPRPCWRSRSMARNGPCSRIRNSRNSSARPKKVQESS